MSYTDVEYKFKRIGKNVSIGRNVYFRYPELVELGNNIIIDEFCYFTTSLLIEDYVHISTGCSVIGGRESLFIMREFSAMGAGSRIVCKSDDFVEPCLTHAHIPLKYRKLIGIGVVEFQRHVILGTSCVCHPDVVLKEGSTVGSLSLVVKDLDPWWVYFGSPAKKHKRRDKEGMLKIVEEFKKEIAESQKTK